MIIIGITGSIASGKSSLVCLLKRRGIVVFDADKSVHHLINNEAFALIANSFPSAIDGSKVNRKKLGEIVFADEKSLEILENILHPLVRKELHHAIKQAYLRRHDMILLDIPLLFENHLHRFCHHVILADILPYLQKRRLIKIRKLSVEIYQAIIDKQMKLSDKRKLADKRIFMNLEYGKNKRQAIALRQKIAKARYKTGFRSIYH
ncbi:MAG: dephospho-CoA kinase [Alphaproteobacteria bacterium]|nr:dephospho-CoA kinase [Alphaproteobacteria bacterium]